jgi:hypothetical protein
LEVRECTTFVGILLIFPPGLKKKNYTSLRIFSSSLSSYKHTKKEFQKNYQFLFFFL